MPPAAQAGTRRSFSRWLGVMLIALAELLALMGSRFRTPHWMRDLLHTTGLYARVEADGATAWIIATK